MYQSAYADICENSLATTRKRESDALDRAIELLELASKHGFHSKDGIEAIFYTNRVWAFLTEDLSLSENELPAEVRANLISIGIYIIQRLDQLRTGHDADASDVIELMTLIRDALQ